MKLRKHQELTLELIAESFKKGNKRIMVGASTSFGKTVLAAHILAGAERKGNKGMFICDRIKLVQQTLEKFDANGLDLGVIQGIHDRYNPDANIQIASVQTLARKPYLPDAKIFIIDEAHIQHTWIIELMRKHNRCLFIGLSATPYSKGLGKHYQDLIVPITTNELLDQGYLCRPRYFVGHHVDLKGLKTKALGTGGSDYTTNDLAKATDNDTVLTGDIIRNWEKHGENSQTIAFSPSIKHSKWLVDQFNARGIPAEHIDGYMEEEERNYLYESHDRGDFKILSCSQLLNTGYDAPSVKCLIDCYPTKSLISYVQRVGRILRTHESKEYCIYLDHAGNVSRHGKQEDITPDILDDGEKDFSERSLTKDKKEPQVKSCPTCFQSFTGMACACGYEIPVRDRMEHDGTNLVELGEVRRKDMTPAQKRNADTTIGEKQDFLAGLIIHSKNKGYSASWPGVNYKERFDQWPQVQPSNIKEIPSEVKKHIQAQNIRRAKGKKYSGG